MRISDWSSDGCSSDLEREAVYSSDDRFCKVEAGCHPTEAGRWKVGCVDRQGLREVLPGTKGTVARSCDDGDPRLIIGGEIVNRSGQLDRRSGDRGQHGSYR